MESSTFDLGLSDSFSCNQSPFVYMNNGIVTKTQSCNNWPPYDQSSRVNATGEVKCKVQ